MDPDKFVLTDKEQDGVYEAIFTEYASGLPSMKFPRLVIVAAQPGAGKSAIAEQARKELLTHGGMPMMVDIDETRQFHLKLPEIVGANPFKMAFYTNRDGWAWTSHLLLDARQAKNNAVYQATIREAKRIYLAFHLSLFSSQLFRKIFLCLP